jgi:hypothetical protein
MPPAIPADRWRDDSHSHPAAAGDHDYPAGLDSLLTGIGASLG